MKEWLLMPILVHIFECRGTKYYSFQAQDMGSCHDLKKPEKCSSYSAISESFKNRTIYRLSIKRQLLFFSKLTDTIQQFFHGIGFW